MKIKNILKSLLVTVITLTLGFFLFRPIAFMNDEIAIAEDFVESSVDGYPYQQTFIISAYYSPLPCQDKYATGSYEADIRLNGHGIHGADGTSVYPGMIAAPKTYAFGTKLHIPGVGIVAIHDRGGAIVPAGDRGNSYDRLDIWMGYGDKGLKRALNWGKRTVDVTIYGVTDGVIEDVYLADYSSDEYLPGECDYANENVVTAGSYNAPAVEEEDEMTKLAKKYNIELSEMLSSYLEPGVEGESVRKLQEELKRLNFYKVEPTGVYDELTSHAVFKFQQSQNIVTDSGVVGAGVFGPKTRQRLNEIIASRNDRKVLIAQVTNDTVYLAKANEKLIAMELDFGITSYEVTKLQKFLKEKGYFTEEDLTGYFGPVTRNALLKFQMDNKLISDEKDTGAGRVGPNTLDLINTLS
ncbi:MAG: peptidoglycan-binding protein [Candidatus Gracilibacteria bacterium]|jgi:peptidoglycan hydrolase-like protein with peptidoglycan-binding domain/3D (Asp-Asp-Asp) domain-containing protein